MGAVRSPSKMPKPLDKKLMPQLKCCIRDVLYPYNVFPVITKPTRVTEILATLIDHILTNNFDINASHIQGILFSSISDRYAIFHVAGNVIADDKLTENPIIRRDMSHKNILKFINEMKEID